MNSKRHARLRRTTFLAVAAISAFVALTLHGLGVTDRLELTTVDLRFDARFAASPGKPPRPPDVAVVAVDAQTFSDLQEPWPFPRSLHAKVIDRLREDGARVVAYDVQFTDPTNEKDDGALLDSLARNRPVVLAAFETDDAGRTNVLGGDDVLKSVGARAGHTAFVPDAAEVYRTFPHTFEGLESFGVVAAEVATGRPLGTERFTEPRGEAWVDYAGPPNTVRTVSFSQVLRGDFRPGTFKGRVVVVGATVATLQDIHPTSTTTGAAQMAGPEIQANAIQTALDGLPLQSSPTWLTIALIVLMAVSVPLATIKVRFRWVLALAVGLAVIYCGGAILAFSVGRILPVAVPLIGLALATVTSTAGYALLTAAERQRTRDLFARFVPEAVVNDVLAKADDDLRLGGQRKEGTVMFCDLRGFTSFAERLEPDRVIEVLNQYLSEMSDAIMEREGTLVAFMGDGIMAVFGAPLDRADHADRAVHAADDMLSVRLPRFNAWLRDQGIAHEFRMGIGINSGPVMSGNVGSSTRVEYTAIGDTTNTAARIESMTKDEPTQVLLSDATRTALMDDATRTGLLAVGERAVRGREAGITLWTLTCGT